MDLPHPTNASEQEAAWRRQKLSSLPADARSRFAAFMLSKPSSEWQDAALLVLGATSRPQPGKPALIDPKLTSVERAVLAHFEPVRRRRDSPRLLDVIDDLLVLYRARSKFHRVAGGSTLKQRTIKHVKNGAFAHLLEALPDLELSRERKAQLRSMLGEYVRRFA